MKYFTLFFLIVFTSCNKETDKDSKKVNFNIKLNTSVNNYDLILGKPILDYPQYLDSHERPFKIELLKFYISNISFKKENGDYVYLDDVFLIDYSNNMTLLVSFDIPSGVYSNFSFGVGLDSLLNSSDPSSFSYDAPLSISQNTYWNWANKYKFFMVEGRVLNSISDSLTPDIFSYHTGFDTLYRNIIFNLNSMQISNSNDTLNLELDLLKVFNGEYGSIDFVNQSFSHSESEFEIVEIISNNLIDAFTITNK
ncbi:MAG: hypothetical protein CMD07_06515 [Flavobacteriales bacterium]|nr:hypothetical protein [Flavobacteriales bacterium]|tara:strand:- start:1919 stop:2677 length:759 start_codon:yes stop_codon:yes gene_type:complete